MRQRREAEASARHLEAAARLVRKEYQEPMARMEVGRGRKALRPLVAEQTGAAWSRCRSILSFPSLAQRSREVSAFQGD